MDITKDLESSVTFIRGLQSEYELSGIPFKDRKGTLSVKERHLEIKFVLSLHESIDALKIIDLNEFCIRNSLTGNRYLIPDRCGYLNGTTNLTADENVACPYTIKISNMMECGWNKTIAFLKEIGLHTFFIQINAICIDYLGFDETVFPSVERKEGLEKRILADILHPEFAEEKPSSGLLTILTFKFRRWWHNRWKHPLVYKEWLLPMFLTLLWSHLRRYKTIKD